jgi:hypothetical protein
MVLATVITIVNYDGKTFIVQAIGELSPCHFFLSQMTKIAFCNEASFNQFFGRGVLSEMLSVVFVATFFQLSPPPQVED